MKSDPIRTRWSDSGPDGDFAERLAGSLFQSASAPRPRRPQAIMALLAEIRRRQLARHAGWFAQAVPLRRAGVVLSAFISINFAMALTVNPVRRWWSNALHLEASRSAALPAPSVAAPAIITDSVLTAAPEVERVPVLTTAGQSPRSPRARLAVLPATLAERLRRHAETRQASALVVPASAPVAAPPAPSPTLVAESQLLERALKALGQGQPAQALSAITAYRQQFPHGSLAYGVDLAEVKAQMAAGQNGRALSVLDKIMATAGFDSLPRSNELMLLHAELLARTKDCSRAIAAFDQLALSPDLEAPLAERALYGRAACFGSQGDWTGNQSALREYLRRFPNGRFSAEAHEGLARGE